MPAQTTAGPAATVRMRDRFNRIASQLTDALGSFEALIASVLLVVVWALTGPIFNFSDTWQLFINTSTTVITFWMVFVIQNAANRDAKAIHLKLDELLRVHNAARNELITLEQQPEEVVAKTAEELASIAREAHGGGQTTVTITERAGTGATSNGETVTATAKATPKPAQGSRPRRATPKRTSTRPRTR